jgi:hypothetical protein
VIVTVVMKMPDALEGACHEAARELETDIEKRDELVDEACGYITQGWMEYGEYIRVRFDTEKGTAEVIPNGH